MIKTGYPDYPKTGFNRTISKTENRVSLKMTSMRSLVIIFPVTLILFQIVGGWKYERPQDWPGICQRGQSQSPVNLEDEIYQVFVLY